MLPRNLICKQINGDCSSLRDDNKQLPQTIVLQSFSLKSLRQHSLKITELQDDVGSVCQGLHKARGKHGASS